MKTHTQLHILLSTAAVALAAAQPVTAQEGAFEPDFDAETRELGGSSVQFTVDYWYRINSADAPAGEAGLVNVATGDNNANLWGAGIGYAINAQLALDFTYYTGSSSFDYTTSSPSQPGLEIVNTPDSTMDWYELRVRFTPAAMAERPLQAYVAAGVTYIRSDDETFSNVVLNGAAVPGLQDLKSVDGKGRSVFATVGAGIGGVKTGEKMSFGYKAEGSFLYGQFKTDNTQIDAVGGTPDVTVSSSEKTWGVSAQAGAFLMLPLNAAQSSQLLIEGGARVYYWDLDSGSQTSWGPYAKAGVSFLF